MPIAIWFLLLADIVLGRKPRARSPEEQARVDAEAKALRLYHFEACPYCRRSRRDIRLLNVPIEQVDIKRDPSAREALVAGGGKKQVPCLRIEEAGATRWMYESREIAEYLYGRFA
jgi:glutaredoxin